MTLKKHRSIFVKIVPILSILILCIPLFAAGTLFQEKIILRTYSQGIPTLTSPLQGLMLLSGANGDFPTQSNISIKAQQRQLEEAVQYAANYGYNAIFFEAMNQEGTYYRSKIIPASDSWIYTQKKLVFFDPLDFLIKACKEKNIQVYAMIQPFSLSDNQSINASTFKSIASDQGALANHIANELTEEYDIAGLLLSDFPQSEIDSTQQVDIIKKISKAIHNPKTQRFGIIASFASNPQVLLESIAHSPDFIVTNGSEASLQKTTEFKEQLSLWQAFCTQKQIDYYPSHHFTEGSSKSYATENALWLEKQILSNGTILSGYSALATADSLVSVSISSVLRQKEEPAMPDFSFSQNFAVTRPTQALYLDSTWESYYITGTSAPNVPVSVNGHAISQTEKGLWGHFVPLSYGTNTILIAQGNNVKNVVIVRNPSAPNTLTGIRSGSAYPTTQEVILPGTTLQVSCIAPAGGSVTASVGGITVPLQAAVGKDGAQVRYQSQVDISSLARSEKVTNIGSVTYHLSYKGFQTTEKSQGAVFSVGSGATPLAKTRMFGTMVNTNPADDGQYMTILRQDCIDEIVANVGNYYKLSVGGYLLKSAVDIQTAVSTADCNVSNVSIKATDKGEKLVLALSNRPTYRGILEEQTFTIQIQNIVGWEKIDTNILESKLCSNISIKSNSDRSTTITFQIHDDVKIAGWDILFDKNNQMEIYLRQKPQIDWTSAQPLSNVTIALDPGHGGSDPGAMGVPGNLGPTENILNLANAYAVQSRLTALGADVYILQENTTSSLDQRLMKSQQLDADLFISNHHNSLSEASDASNVTGVEVYYWNDFSENLAQTIGENLSAQTGRPLRNVTQSWYRVTMMYACPAVLVESGFINNPTEYEQIADPFGMHCYANALTNAILSHFKD